MASAEEARSSKVCPWLPFMLVVIACTFSSGPVNAWPTLEPVLINAGLFNGNEEKLALVSNAATSVLLVAGFPSGIVYDKFGGRVAGCLGALLTSFGLLLMSFAMIYPADFSWVFYFGYPITVAAGPLNASCMFDFMWMHPEHQALIGAFSVGSQSFSDLLANVAVFAHNSYGLSITNFFVALAAANVVTIIVCLICVPSREVALLNARRLAGSSETSAQRSSTKIRLAWLAIRKHSRANVIMILFSSFYVASISTLGSYLFPYYEKVFPSSTARDLGFAFGIISGIGGACMTLLGGGVCDVIGLPAFLRLDICSILFTMCIVIPSVAVQYVSQVLLAAGLGLYLVTITRFCTLYSPPDLFGTYQGILSVLVGVVNMFLGQVSAQIIGSGSSIGALRLGFLIPIGGSTLFGLALCALWRKSPPEMASVTSCDDVDGSPTNLIRHHLEDLAGSCLEQDTHGNVA